MLVLGVERVFHKLQFFVQVLVHEFESIEDLRIDDVELGEEDVELLEVDRPLPPRNLLEPLHHELLGH